MNAVERCDALENELLKRIQSIYGKAMEDALRRKKAFLQIIRDIDEGRIKPPKYYVDTDHGGDGQGWRKGRCSRRARES